MTILLHMAATQNSLFRLNSWETQSQNSFWQWATRRGKPLAKPFQKEGGLKALRARLSLLPDTGLSWNLLASSSTGWHLVPTWCPESSSAFACDVIGSVSTHADTVTTGPCSARWVHNLLHAFSQVSIISNVNCTLPPAVSAFNF